MQDFQELQQAKAVCLKTPSGGNGGGGGNPGELEE